MQSTRRVTQIHSQCFGGEGRTLCVFFCAVVDDQTAVDRRCHGTSITAMSGSFHKHSMHVSFRDIRWWKVRASGNRAAETRCLKTVLLANVVVRCMKFGWSHSQYPLREVTSHCSWLLIRLFFLLLHLTPLIKFGLRGKLTQKPSRSCSNRQISLINRNGV